MKLSHEIVEKIKSAGSPDEVLAIAKECNVEMTPDEAKSYFEQINSHELDEDLLDGVSGGWLIFNEGENSMVNKEYYQEHNEKGLCG